MNIFKAIFDGDLQLVIELLDNDINDYPFGYLLRTCSILYYQNEIFYELIIAQGLIKM